MPEAASCGADSGLGRRTASRRAAGGRLGYQQAGLARQEHESDDRAGIHRWRNSAGFFWE